MGDSTSTLSAGTNALLRLGAAPVTRAADVLELFGIEPRSAAAAASLGPVADTLLSTLSEQALTADELVRVMGLEPSQGAAALVELELAGRVTIEDGVYRVAI
jgi:DNA processing protein